LNLSDLARINHILIPQTKSERDRYRRGRLARRLRPFIAVVSRLSREGRAFLTLVCATAVFCVDMGRTQSHVLVFATLSLLVAAVLFTGRYRLTGVAVRLSAPARVAVGDEININLFLRNDGEKDHLAIRVELPFLPWDGAWTAPPETIAELPAKKRASAVARARFIARGEHHLDPFRVAALLPLGLSQGPRISTEGLRFVVVPKVAHVLSVTTPGNRRYQPGGVANASRTGDATDLLGIRPYRPGDPVRDLHAVSWARHGQPMVREYQEEYFTRIGVVVDTDVTAASPAHLEAALSLAAGVVAKLCCGEALVQLLVAGERMQKLSVGRSLGSLDQALDALATVRSVHGFTAERVLTILGPELERLSSVVFVALAADPAREVVASAIRARGIGCLMLVVSDQASRTRDTVTVALDAIAKGEELSL
jgi:uncharacterized protein (DUF58 family)